MKALYQARKESDFLKSNSLREPETIRWGSFFLQHRAGPHSGGKSLSGIPRLEVPALTPRPPLPYFHPRPRLSPPPTQKKAQKISRTSDLVWLTLLGRSDPGPAGPQEGGNKIKNSLSSKEKN